MRNHFVLAPFFFLNRHFCTWPEYFFYRRDLYLKQGCNLALLPLYFPAYHTALPGLRDMPLNPAAG